MVRACNLLIYGHTAFYLGSHRIIPGSFLDNEVKQKNSLYQQSSRLCLMQVISRYLYFTVLVSFCTSARHARHTTKLDCQSINAVYTYTLVR